MSCAAPRLTSFTTDMSEPMDRLQNEGVRLTYALITPARDERDNLERLARCLVAQTTLPVAWIVVDNGSTDGTADLCEELVAEHPWIRNHTSPPAEKAEPGQPIVRAFHAGLAELDASADVFVKLDADVSFDTDHFARLLEAFDRDPRLGIAGGTCFEFDGDEWRPTHVTGEHVRGAVRAYRRACLDDVLPLEEGLGWDTIDELKATAAGWRTGIVPGLRFDHHRPLGARDGRPWSRAMNQGRASRYMGYRLWYLGTRALFRARKDPAALAMIWGYALSALRREELHPDQGILAQVRNQQRLAQLPIRAREALGRRLS